MVIPNGLDIVMNAIWLFSALLIRDVNMAAAIVAV